MMDNFPKIIGITGGIGSGKSVVSRILRLNDFPVYDCDLEARKLMERHPEVRAGLISLLGEEIYKADGTLDRPSMASRIFGDAETLASVNGIVHAAVREDVRDYILRHRNSRIVFCESAILSTSHLDGLCDSIWVVTAPEELRIERVMLRNGLSREEVEARIQTQRGEFESLPEDKVIRIENDGSPIVQRILEMTETNIK